MADATDNTEQTAVVETAASDTLKTKSAALSGILATISGLSHEEMMKWLDSAVQMHGTGSAAANAATLKMKPSAASAAMKEDADSLLEGEELSEEKKADIVKLIENAADVRVTLIRAKLEEEKDAAIAEGIEAGLASLKEDLEKYVAYAAEQWVQENEVAIENAVKVQRADRLIEGLKTLMAEAAIDVSDETVDAVAELTAKHEDVEAKLNAKIEESIELQAQIDRLNGENVFRQVAEGLALTEVEKFKKLIEDIDLGGELDAVREKITIVRDAHFKKDKTAATGLAEQMLSEGNEAEAAPVVENKAEEDPRMARYAAALSRAGAGRYGTPR